MRRMQEITEAEFKALMGSSRIVAFSVKYEPRGLFFLRDGDKVIGIDNSTGHAWTRSSTAWISVNGGSAAKSHKSADRRAQSPLAELNLQGDFSFFGAIAVFRS